ncbi:uncharacterized protein LOC133711477 [Rosa rugosa]|uniref:uncharacterized protein LOC133711477 n=1 Tax=Rosa rugosa TaxID=74645 RepID=UPI002B401BFC|nr:uncharacterized protein LOC133711477 [Rosa rugosa]
MFAGTRDNVQNQSWSEDQDSGSIHSFYDITANPLDKQASGSKSDKRRRLMLESSVDSSIQVRASLLKSDKRKQLISQGGVNNECMNNLLGCELQAGTSKIGQASYQKSIQGTVHDYSDVGDKIYCCCYCNALFWRNESKKQSSNNKPPVFTHCCREGKICLPPEPDTPEFLDKLLDPSKNSLFRANIRIYNSMFNFTSMGGKVDHSVNNGSGPYVFRISGQVCHLMGSLLPPDGECPKFAQLYIYDTCNEVLNRMRAADPEMTNDTLDPNIVRKLTMMFNEINEVAKYFRNIKSMYQAKALPSLHMSILDQQISDGRQYEQPASEEISGLIVGDIGLFYSERDIVSRLHDGRLQRITKLCPKYMSLQYPILFPYGQDGFSLNLKLRLTVTDSDKKRERISMRSYYAYRIQERTNENGTLLKGGRLFQQFLVDCYATVEEDRLDYVRNNQASLRSEVLKGMYDAVSRGENDARNIGQKVILPSSFTGSPRYMINNYQDAMAICRQYGNPDLFITFTCNVKWPEIIREFEKKSGYKADDRPDIISRIFKIKQDDLIAFIKSGEPFGEVEAAELPNKSLDPQLYEIVTQFMIHGPCGNLNVRSPCMQNGKCSKHFPKAYQTTTLFETGTVPLYRRRPNVDNLFVKNGVNIDNSFVVPYNKMLLLKYKAHINVESCSHSMLIKYLFKYINKGPDRARVVLQDNMNDEIKTYLNCRYLSPPEAVWRLFEYPIHSRHPAVQRLPVHLPFQQNVVFNESQQLESIVRYTMSKDTMLTAWFKANVDYPEARSLTYAEFPSKFVWDNKGLFWKPRKLKGSLGRIASIHPASGELYYLRMLLNLQKGCIDYNSIKTVNGEVKSSYQEACRSMGLLGDDKEWIEALTNSSLTATASELRQLFVTIVMFCDVSNPQLLFDTHWISMCDDIRYNFMNDSENLNISLSDSEMQNSLLFELEKIFNSSSSSLKNYHLPMPDENKMIELHNKLLREELDYDFNTLKQEHAILVTQLNAGQKAVYESVIKVVEESKPGLFFVNGHGGTGKTFLWHVIISKLRSERKIVLAVASSGIASLLLPNGRTAHSRFKIPIVVNDCSVCSVKKGTNLAKLIEKAHLVIWDEAPMNHKHCFESLDKTLRDILPPLNNSELTIPFGGKPFLFGGDFRQILPVVTGGKKEDIINAALNSSYLWSEFKTFPLTENMRLHKENLTDEEKMKISIFAKWILDIGDGVQLGVADQTDSDASWIEIPKELLIHANDDPISQIFLATYPAFNQNHTNYDYLRERAIVTPRNKIVYEINDHIINQLPGDERIYLSSDTVCSTSENHEKLAELYSVEFLNSLELNGLPPHKLQLKIGMPIMLLRNLNQTVGLCNGTRLVVTNMLDRVIEARILTGNKIDHKVYLPRIVLTSTENKWPFILKRRQFPVRPCYAMTINKSQGQSLKQVGVYLPESVFTHGQLYVALSRVTSIDGLKILIQNNNNMPDTHTKNIVYKDVLKKL